MTCNRPSQIATFRKLVAHLCFTFFNSMVLADDWPQWLGPKRDGIYDGGFCGARVVFCSS